jgi:hypothetical protein
MSNVHRTVFALAFLAGCSGSSGTNTDAGLPPICANIEGNLMQDGLTIRKPDADAVGAHEIPNPSGSNPVNVLTMKTPDVSCIGMHQARGTSIKVHLRGCVDAFGVDPGSTHNLTVTLFHEVGADGKTPIDPGYDLMGQPGMQADKTPSAFIGKTISVDQPMGRSCKSSGWYDITNVPTETPLVVRVTDQNIPTGSRLMVDTYQYNYVLLNKNIEDMNGNPIMNPETACSSMECFYTRATNTVLNATFTLVAHAGGVSVIQGSDNLYDGVGQGHIAGEVRDCSAPPTTDKIMNAVVNIDATARKIDYFNVGFGTGTWDIDNAQPESTRTRTNADGLYAAMAIDSMTGGQPVRVGAAITKAVCAGPGGACHCNPDGTVNAMVPEGDATYLGSHELYVFPDSITIFTFDAALYTAP